MTRARDLADSADLSFDAGTLVVDATNNRVGIGGSPNAILDVQAGAGANLAKIRSGSTNGTYFWEFGRNNSDGFFELGQAQGGSVTNNLIVDTAGRVGIGGSPSTTLDVVGSGVPIQIDSSNSNTYKIQFSDNQTTTAFLGSSANKFWFANASGTALATFDNDGLKFNGDTAAANALNDYETGFYTPTDVSGQGLTIANSGSSYVKIGKLVHVNLYITFPATSNTTQAKISLPYGAASTSYGYSYLEGRLQNGSPLPFESAFTCQVNAGSNNFYVGYYSTTNSQVLTYNQLNGKYLLVSGTYVSDT